MKSGASDQTALEEDLAADQQGGNRVATNPGLPAATTSKEDSSLASESSGFGSLTKKRTAGEAPTGLSGLTDSGVAEPSGGSAYDAMMESMASTISDLANAQSLQSGISSASAGVPLSNQMLSSTDHGHSRNSSNTSQVREFEGAGPE